MNRDRAALYPPFASQILQFEMELLKEGLPFYLFDGYRSVADQDKLYAQGRWEPGKIVTKAPGGSSYHNFGLATDFARDGDTERPGIQWSWDMAGVNRALWQKMADVARKCGLEAGFYWKFQDPPHVQNTFGFTLPELRGRYRTLGLAGVWELIDCRRLQKAQIATA